MLSNDEIKMALPEGWAGDARGIEREFRFASYAEGVAFAVHVALVAERVNHHPDEMRVMWKRVVVRFVTHSAGGVTALDIKGAALVNAAFARAAS